MTDTPTSPPHRRPTIKEVAKHAGVGTMTVSRVVTGKGYVSLETKEKVEASIAALGYLPNRQARGLRSRLSGTLGLIVSDLTNPYFTTLARGAEDAAKPQGSLLLVASSDESEEEEVRCMRLLVERGVDGILFVPSHRGERALEIAASQRVPCVVVDRRAPLGFHCVRCSSLEGARQAGALLHAEGHQRAVILAAEEGVSTSDDRVEGFLSSFGRRDGETAVLRGPMTVEAGEKLGHESLALSPRPTCLFAVNNFLAIGALRAFQAEAVAIPSDLSVVGFDDLPSSMLAFPFLTVVHQPAREMGFLAAERLLALIEDPTLPAEETLLPTTLLRRGSVGPPRW